MCGVLVKVGFDKWENPKIWCSGTSGINDSPQNNSQNSFVCELRCTCFLC